MKLSINWTKLAESLAQANPYGPFVAPDGSIYGCDGALLAGPRDGSPMVAAGSTIGRAVTEPAAQRTARAPIGLPAFGWPPRRAESVRVRVRARGRGCA
jgi:hypothetical protein